MMSLFARIRPEFSLSCRRSSKLCQRPEFNVLNMPKKYCAEGMVSMPFHKVWLVKVIFTSDNEVTHMARTQAMREKKSLLFEELLWGTARVDVLNRTVHNLNRKIVALSVPNVAPGAAALVQSGAFWPTKISPESEQVEMVSPVVTHQKAGPRKFG